MVCRGAKFLLSVGLLTLRGLVPIAIEGRETRGIFRLRDKPNFFLLKMHFLLL